MGYLFMILLLFKLSNVTESFISVGSVHQREQPLRFVIMTAMCDGFGSMK